MKCVLDSNVALKWVIPESDSDIAIQLRDNFQANMHELLAPDVLPVECLHALTKAERQNRITGGLALWQAIMVDSPALHPHIPLLPRAYQIASSARIGVYDCLYVALAEREGCKLVTADDRLVNTLRAQFSFVTRLAELP